MGGRPVMRQAGRARSGASEPTAVEYRQYRGYTGTRQALDSRLNDIVLGKQGHDSDQLMIQVSMHVASQRLRIANCLALPSPKGSRAQGAQAYSLG